VSLQLPAEASPVLTPLLLNSCACDRRRWAWGSLRGPWGNAPRSMLPCETCLSCPPVARWSPSGCALVLLCERERRFHDSPAPLPFSSSFPHKVRGSCTLRPCDSSNASSQINEGAKWDATSLPNLEGEAAQRPVYLGSLPASSAYSAAAVLGKNKKMIIDDDHPQRRFPLFAFEEPNISIRLLSNSLLSLASV
jgi:hypothetical protein